MAKKMTTPKATVKPAAKAKSKPTNTLDEVKITATRLAKPSGVTGLYPKGSVKNSQLDSIRKANPALGRKIGKPIANSQDRYGSSQSDLIKSAIKPKKK